MLDMAPLEGPQSPVLSLSPVVIPTVVMPTHDSSSRNNLSADDLSADDYAQEASARVDHSFVLRTMHFDDADPIDMGLTNNVKEKQSRVCHTESERINIQSPPLLETDSNLLKPTFAVRDIQSAATEGQPSLHDHSCTELHPTHETTTEKIEQSPIQPMHAPQQEDPASPTLSPERQDAQSDNPLAKEDPALSSPLLHPIEDAASQPFSPAISDSVSSSGQMLVDKVEHASTAMTSAELDPTDNLPPESSSEKISLVHENDQSNASQDSSIPPPKQQSPLKQPVEFCPSCYNLCQQNDRLERRVARLRMRLHESIETAQTHGQRLLRAAFQEKLREMTAEHAQRTTEMLNMQKKCFEDELEVVESETQAAMHALQKQLADERDERDQLLFRYERERDDTLEKAETTMQAVQRKLAQMHARATRLEREKNELAAAHDQKQLMIEVLASTAAAKDVERRRLVVLENGQEEERKRKNSLIDSLQREVADLRMRLETEVEQNRNTASKVARLEKERRDDSQRHAEDLEGSKEESKKEIDRMGRLFASMVQDFAQVP